MEATTAPRNAINWPLLFAVALAALGLVSFMALHRTLPTAALLWQATILGVIYYGAAYVVRAIWRQVWRLAFHR